MAKRMTIPWLRRWWQACGRALLPLALSAVPVGAAEPGAPAVPPVTLIYSETPYSVNNVGVSLTPQAAPFKKEPTPGGKVLRGTLNFGGTGNSVAFLWQIAQGKLYLDLNQNQDLTDDPAGVFFKSGFSGPSYHQAFTNIHLSLRTPAGTCRAVADLHFWNLGLQPSCDAEWHSFWQGKVTLAGEDWQVGLIPDFAGADFRQGGSLLLRPWARHNESFSAGGNACDALPFSEQLFAGGHAYQVRCRQITRGADFEPALEFTEQSVPLGELRITGKFIRRLVLTGGNYLVICDRPAETVKVPVGTYFPPQVLLEQDGMQAYCRPANWGLVKSVLITGQAPWVLATGGPLTNSVTAARRGENLTLNYQLVGAGGQAYQMMDTSRTRPPEFAVYKGRQKIATGSFEFG